MLLRVSILLFFASLLSLHQGIAQNTTQKRVTVSPLTGKTSPKIVSQYPAKAATKVPVASQIILQFDKAIQKGEGSLIIQKKQDNTPIQIIDVSSFNVQLEQNRVLVNLSVPLAHYTAYTIQIDTDFVKDLEGNSFAGTKAGNEWSFTTQKPARQKILNVFPTPATDYFNVQLKGVQIKVARMELYNSKGELLKAQLLKPGKNASLEQKVWIRDLPEGYYILRVITPNYLMEKRVLKQY